MAVDGVWFNAESQLVVFLRATSDEEMAFRSMQDTPMDGFDLERGFALLRNAIAAQKRGQSVPDLWAVLFAECGADVGAVNRLVRDYSDAVTQGFPKLDIYSYQDCVRAKVKEHDYLLHALNDGFCLTNRKISPETYMALFENAERLAAVQAVVAFLGNKFLHNVIVQAGELIRPEWEEEMSLEVTSGIDRFFASIHESPQKLARSIARRCHEMERSLGVTSIQQQFDWMQSLAEIACDMFTAVRAKRHDLEIRYNRERVLANTTVTNWLACVSFHEMWDSILYGSTQLLVSVTEKDFEHPMAKPLAMHCIRLAQQLSDSLYSMLQDDPMDDYMLVSMADQEDLVELPDRYATLIVNACFGRDKTTKADESIYTQLMILCKSGKCFNALFMLLYICLEDVQQLYEIMIEWTPIDPRDIVGSFVTFVFDKWMTSGKPRDMQYLLKGPPELDARLVQFLLLEDRYELAAAIQMRMGNMRGAKQTVSMKRGLQDLKREVSNLYLLAACLEDRPEASRAYLQTKLNCICHRFNFIAIQADTVPVLHELIYMMHRSPNYSLMHSALDIFVYEHSGFYKKKSPEWEELWRILGGFMQLDGPCFNSDMFYYGNEDFYLLQRACDKLLLSEEERERVYNVIVMTLRERCLLQRGQETVPQHVNQMLLTALDLVWTE